MSLQDIHPAALYTANTAAVTATATSWLSWLPPFWAGVASFLSVVWFIFQLWEMKSFRAFITKVKRWFK